MPNLPTIVLIVLLLCLVASLATKINIGWLAAGAALLLGLGAAGLSLQELWGGFPVDLFLTLVGVTFLFSHAHANGTLEQLVVALMRQVARVPALAPWSIYGIAMILSALGAGNIAATAILAPMAMALPTRGATASFLVAVMVANGANAGALSPLAPTGILLGAQLASNGLAGIERGIFAQTLIVSTLVAALAYVGFRGTNAVVFTAEKAAVHWSRKQRATLVILGLTVALALTTELPLAVLGFGGGLLLALFPGVNHKAVVKAMPWGAIAMVCGVVFYIALAEKMGAMDLLVELTSRYATRDNLVALGAFTAGLASVFSSSSGVVMPTFLPLVPQLMDHVGGGDPVPLTTAIVVSSHLVDVSPLSTLGALCLAALPDPKVREAVFYKMLAWGLAMTVVGAVLCQLWFNSPLFQIGSQP